MKTLNIPLEDTEFQELEELKGDMTWKSFIMESARKNKKKKEVTKSN